MSVDDLMAHLVKIRRARGMKSQGTISLNDVGQSVEKLSVLGSGFRISTIASRDFLISVPLELSSDQTKVLEVAKLGHCTIQELKALTGWDVPRCERTLDDLLSSGLAWFDPVDSSFWFPTLLHLQAVD